jgi:hypothetical protein
MIEGAMLDRKRAHPQATDVACRPRRPAVSPDATVRGGAAASADRNDTVRARLLRHAGCC